MKLSTSLKVILFVSLAANVFLIGYLIGESSHGFKRHSMHERHMMRAMLKDLSPETKQKVEPLLKTSKETFKNNKKQIRKHRQEIANLLMQESLDKEQLQSHFTAIQKLANEKISTSQQMMYEAILHLSPQERKAIAEHLQKHPRKKYRRH